jgi:hypothetical protein
MLLGAQRLRYGEGQDYVSIETRLSPEWQREVFDYMTELEGWEPQYEESESKIVFFHRKAALYRALLDLTPKSAFKQRVLSSYGSYLGRSPVQSSGKVAARRVPLLDAMVSFVTPRTKSCAGECTSSSHTVRSWVCEKTLGTAETASAMRNTRRCPQSMTARLRSRL